MRDISRPGDQERNVDDLAIEVGAMAVDGMLSVKLAMVGRDDDQGVVEESSGFKRSE